MDWSKGYTAHWRVFEVNTATWADGAVLEGVTSCSVERDGTGDAPLLESGSIQIDQMASQDFAERYLRIVVDALQDDGAQRVEVATLLCSAESGEINRGNDDVELTGRSVLYPASTRRVTAGMYAPKGINGVEWVAGILSETIAAPITSTGSFTLESNVVFDVGNSYLECAWKVLNAGNFVMQIQGDGTVEIKPMPTLPDIELDESGARLLHPGIRHELDYSDIPNRYYAIEGHQNASATNSDAASPTSTVNRGYFHDVVDTSPVRVDGESLAQYCLRRLEEESTVTDTRTYTREYYPGILPYSIVRGSLASVGLEGDLRIQTQSLTCDKGITVNEKAAKEVRTWQR